jgi:PAS domain S-box-containing protein
MDRDWRIVRVNRRQEELSGKPRSQTVGRTFAAVWPELVQPASRYWREFERCTRERVPVHFEEYYAPLDLWTDVTAYPVSTGGIAVFFRDVTQRRRAEEALRDSEQSLRFVLDNMAEGLVIFDASGNIKDQNPASVRIHDKRLSGEHRRFDQLVVNWKVRKYPDGSLVPPEHWAIPRVIRGEHVLS